MRLMSEVFGVTFQKWRIMPPLPRHLFSSALKWKVSHYRSTRLCDTFFRRDHLYLGSLWADSCAGEP